MTGSGFSSQWFARHDPRLTTCSLSFSTHQVGDGTTSVTLLAAEFLRQLKPYVEEGLHPQTIIRAFRTATHLAVKKINEISVPVKKGDKK